MKRFSLIGLALCMIIIAADFISDGMAEDAYRAYTMTHAGDRMRLYRYNRAFRHYGIWYAMEHYGIEPKP